MIKITAIASNIYQLDTLKQFNIGSKLNPDGTYTGERYFNDLQQAKDFILSIAYKYTDLSAEIISNIDKGILTIDSVTAKIEVI